MEDATRRFNAIDNKTEMKEILTSVYHSLVVKGYNPINQLVGYILSEDPTRGMPPFSSLLRNCMWKRYAASSASPVR